MNSFFALSINTLSIYEEPKTIIQNLFKDAGDKSFYLVKIFSLKFPTKGLSQDKKKYLSCAMRKPDF